VQITLPVAKRTQVTTGPAWASGREKNFVMENHLLRKMVMLHAHYWMGKRARPSKKSPYLHGL
jgi:hypothetical protein